MNFFQKTRNKYMEEASTTVEPLIQLSLGFNTDSKHNSFYNFMDISNIDSRQDLVEAAKYNKMAILNASIDTIPNINEIQDGDKRTILHYLALNTNSYIFNRLMMKYQNQAKDWLQKQDKFGLQAIHYFIYKGKIELLEEITQFYKPERLLGMAAINNDIMSMILIKEKMGQERLYSKYHNDVTPLHLACYAKSDYAAIVLMKWKHPLDVIDFEGNTPLHIAAKQKNPKMIRKLIQRGSSVKAKNMNGLLPVDLTNDEQTIQALKAFRFSWKSLLLQLNIKPRKRSSIQAIIFILFFSFINIGTMLTVYNTLYKEQITVGFVFFIIIVILFTFSYLIVSFQNPGYDKPKNEQNMKEILLKLEPFEICYDCFIQIPNRSKHCEFCKRCVICYDHHCPWINNCVGQENLSMFWIFLLFLFIDIAFLIILDIIALSSLSASQEKDRFIILIFFATIEILFLIPLLNLIYIQLSNYYYGQTTYERLILEKPKNKKRESILSKMSAIKI